MAVQLYWHIFSDLQPRASRQHGDDLLATFGPTALDTLINSLNKVSPEACDTRCLAQVSHLKVSNEIKNLPCYAGMRHLWCRATEKVHGASRAELLKVSIIPPYDLIVWSNLRLLLAYILYIGFMTFYLLSLPGSEEYFRTC